MKAHLVNLASLAPSRSLWRWHWSKIKNRNGCSWFSNWVVILLRYLTIKLFWSPVVYILKDTYPMKSHHGSLFNSLLREWKTYRPLSKIKSPFQVVMLSYWLWNISEPLKFSKSRSSIHPLKHYERVLHANYSDGKETERGYITEIIDWLSLD